MSKVPRSFKVTILCEEEMSSKRITEFIRHSLAAHGLCISSLKFEPKSIEQCTELKQ